MKITTYNIKADIENSVKAVFVSDLHGFPNKDIINEINNHRSLSVLEESTNTLQFRIFLDLPRSELQRF